jgi:hypothetical protein
MSLLRSLSLVLLVFSAPFILAQDGDNKSKTGGDQTSTPRSVVALKKVGIKTCAESAASIVHFLDESDEAAYLNLWQPTDTDKHASLTVLGNSYSDSPMIAAIGVAPTKGDSCDALFTQVWLSKESCGKMRETFKEWKYYSDLGSFSVYEDPTSPSVNMILVPVQNGGCLIVKAGDLMMNASENPEHSSDPGIDSNERAAIGTMRTYNTALVVYASTYPKTGFPKSLEALGGSIEQEASREHGKLIESARSTPPYEASGYRFTYRSKGNSFYAIVGRPTKYGKSGRLSFYTDSSGVIRYTEEDREPTEKDPALK